MDAVVHLVLLSSMAALLLASMIVAASIKKAAQLNSSGRLMQAKLKIYQSVIEVYRHYLGVELQPSPAELVARLNQLEAELTILASGPVIEAHRKLQVALEEKQEDNFAWLFQQLVKSIRRDLGHGSGYDESKLRFLMQAEGETHSSAPVHGSSV
jgi:uncharacterized protein YciI